MNFAPFPELQKSNACSVKKKWISKLRSFDRQIKNRFCGQDMSLLSPIDGYQRTDWRQKKNTFRSIFWGGGCSFYLVKSKCKSHFLKRVQVGQRFSRPHLDAMSVVRSGQRFYVNSIYISEFFLFTMPISFRIANVLEIKFFSKLHFYPPFPNDCFSA